MTRRLQLVDQVRRGGGCNATLGGDLANRFGLAVPADHGVSVTKQPLAHVGAHTSESDQSKLHAVPSEGWCCRRAA